MEQFFKILDDFKLSKAKGLEKAIYQLDKSALDHLYQAIEEYYQENLVSTIKEVQQGEGFNIYLSRVPSSSNLQILRASCLYADKVIMWDPLYGLLSDLQRGISCEGIKQQLVYQLPEVLAIRDLAEYGILALVPHTVYPEETIQEIDQISKKDSQEEEFRRVCFDNMELRMEHGKTSAGYSYSMHVVELGSSRPRTLTIDWSATIPPLASYCFRMPLGGPCTLETPEGSIVLKPRKVPLLDTIETDEEAMKAVSSTIYNCARDLNFDLVSSEFLDAVYFTNFDVHWQLLDLKLRASQKELKREGKSSTVFPSILQMDLKFLDRIPLNKIIKVRERNKDTFEEFRLMLKEICQNIESIPFTKDFQKEVINLRKERIEPKLRKMDREFDRIRKHRLIRVGVGGMVAISSLVASVLVGGNPLAIPTGLGVAIQSLREYTEYRKEISGLKENPLYFLWSVKRV